MIHVAKPETGKNGEHHLLHEDHLFFSQEKGGFCTPELK